MKYTDKKGTVSIETAISFSILLIFITAIISVTAFLRTDILMQRAVSQSCEDVSRFMPFSVLASDSISTLVNALPNECGDNDTFERVGVLVAGADELTGGSLRAGLLNLMLGRRFTDDIAAYYVEYNGSSFWAPSSIYADFDIEDFYISVYVNYSINTLIGPVSRDIVSTIPFYGNFELFLSGQEPVQDDNDIWHQNNFDRGRYFQERYGANLPSTFPSIDYDDGNGHIGSIVSIDLNRPTYSSPDACAGRVIEQIDQLSSFNGADVTINGSRYAVNGDSINRRDLIVVIPEDSPEVNRQTVNALSGYASSMGVNLIIEEYGSSL